MSSATLGGLVGHRAAEGSAAVNGLPIMNLFPIPKMRSLMSRIPMHPLDDALVYQLSEPHPHLAVDLQKAHRNHFTCTELDVRAALPLELS